MSKHTTRLAKATEDLLYSLAYGNSLEQARARSRARAALKSDATSEAVAALKRVGCQDHGSCGSVEPDGLCFVCAAIASAEGRQS